MRFLADENFNNDILRGVWRRIPDADFTRIQDTELAGRPDTQILAWAAEQGYLLLTHDVNTMRGYFYDRANAELPVPGVFLVHANKPVGAVIAALELIILASTQAEWEGKIEYLP